MIHIVKTICMCYSMYCVSKHSSSHRSVQMKILRKWWLLHFWQLLNSKNWCFKNWFAVCLPQVEDSRPILQFWSYSRWCHQDNWRWRYMQHPPLLGPAWGSRVPSWPTAQNMFGHRMSVQPGCISYLLGSSEWNLHNKQPRNDMTRRMKKHLYPGNTFNISVRTVKNW